MTPAKGGARTGRAMNSTRLVATGLDDSLCTNCGIPLDAKYFDESGVAELPGPSQDVVLARFQLVPQYCGALEYFSQFTDLYARDPSRIETPGLEWVILANNRPLHPYLRLDRALNPWGYGSFQFSVRLDEGTTLEFLVRRAVLGTASGSGPFIAPFSTSIVLNITGGSAPQTVKPVSMAQITPGKKLLIGAGGGQEWVTVTASTRRDFTAVFKNNHTGPVAVTGEMLTRVGGRIMGRYWYNAGYGELWPRRS